MNQSPKITLDADTRADPTGIIGEPGLYIEEAKNMFRSLWEGFIGQWGPPQESQDRSQHCWRLRVLLNELETISEPYDGDDIEKIPEEWQSFLESLPGFCSYWACGCAAHQHGEFG